MSKRGIYLDMEQLNLIRYLENKIDQTSPLKVKLDKLIDWLYNTQNTLDDGKYLSDLRLKHHPTITAEFLSLFGAPDGLKFLTHEFDPESGLNIATIREQALAWLSSIKYCGKLPKSLYALINGFINGEKWIDYEGANHQVYLNSSLMKEWCNLNPNLHPITSSEFGQEVQSFRNTVRLNKPDFPKRLSRIIEKNKMLQGLEIQSVGLDKVDFYTNVFILFQQILRRTLFDIQKRDSNAKVIISYDRSSWNEYRLHQLRIIHKGSEANLIDDVQNKLRSGGGDLFEIAQECVGYCDWTVEANFEGSVRRWRVLDSRNLPEVEELNKYDVEGFTHIFSFYKYK